MHIKQCKWGSSHNLKLYIDDKYKFISAFHFPPVNITPIYSPGTSNLLTQQPQNCTFQSSFSSS